MFSRRNGWRAKRAALCCLVTATPSLSFAQHDIATMVVTGTRAPKALEQSAADLVVITAADIRRSTADSVEGLLRQFAGLQLSRNGGPGQSSALFIRGAAATGTVVLVDGVRIGSATLGYAELGVLSLSQIERVEIRRGPASSLYGADAVGGVINIITRQGQDTPKLSLQAQAGNHGAAQADASFSGRSGVLDYALSAAYETADGSTAVRPGDRFGLYNPDDDGYSRRVGSLQLGWTPVQGHRLAVKASANRLNAQYDGAEYAPPNYLPDASPDFRNRLNTQVLSADYRGQWGHDLTTTVQGSQQVDDLHSGGNEVDRFRTERHQGTWQTTWDAAPGQQWLVALDWMKERASGTAFMTDVARENKALVLGYSGQFGAQGIELSARRDDNDVYGGNTTGSLGWHHQLNREWRVRSLIGTSFRAPSFNELFYPGYGVSTIRPEKGRSFELGLDWQWARQEAAITWFDNRVKDLIGYEPDLNGGACPPGYFGCAANIARARMQGVTLSGTHRWGPWVVKAGVDWLEARDDDTGQRLARRSAHQERLNIDYVRGPWEAGVNVLGVGARPDGGKRLGAYAVTDLRAAWRMQPGWTWTVRVLNVFDRDVEPVRDYQAPGRQLWLGMQLDHSVL